MRFLMALPVLILLKIHDSLLQRIAKRRTAR